MRMSEVMEIVNELNSKVCQLEEEVVILKNQVKANRNSILQGGLY